MLFRGRMTVLLVLFMVIVAILLYLLLAPFYFEINSAKNICRVRFHQLASARIWLTEESLFLDIVVFGWHKKINLLAGKEKEKQARKTKAKKRSFRISVKKIRAVIRSFKLSKCRLSVDTGDMALNGILYPWFLWVGRLMKKDIRINFYNETKIVLVVENNFYRVLRAYVFN